MPADPGPATIFKAAEEAARYVRDAALAPAGFELALSDAMTLGGYPDQSGAGMAVVLDQILARGFVPAGFEQRSGYRLYRYRARGTPAPLVPETS